MKQAFSLMKVNRYTYVVVYDAYQFTLQIFRTDKNENLANKTTFPVNFSC